MRGTRYVGYAALLILSAGCGSEGDSAPADIDVADAGEQDANVGPDFESDGGAYFADGGMMLEGTHANVIRQILFEGEVETGVARGFDLDGVVSPEDDEASCGHGDLMSPDGREGIDNQLALLWQVIEPLVGVQVQELLQGAINEGRVLVVAELDGVDDLVNDDDVTLRLFRVRLDPDIGTLGLISPSQTYYFDYEAPVSEAEGVAIVDGRVTAGPVQLDLPINILELDTILPLEDAVMEFNIADDGTFSGIFAGAIYLPDVIDALLNTPAAEETRLVAPFFEAYADMDPVDGQCQRMSATFGFEGTTAFVVRDSARE